MRNGRETRTNLNWNNWGENDWGLTRLHIAPTGAPAAAARAAGHDLAGPQPPAALITVDGQPGDTSTTATLIVGAPSTISTIDTIGDQDFFRVTLVAGQDYEFGMYGYVGGPNGLPLNDAFIEIYDSAGHLIVSADGGATTPANDINSGFDVLLTYTPGASGTYYVNARAFDQDPTNNVLVGGPGDGIGDYELFVRDALPNAYQPYYDVDSPLYAIDWGTQVDGTARNPDGNEGTRDTGNLQGIPDPLVDPVAGKNVITIYFAKAGDVYTSNDPTNPGLPPAIVAVGAKDFEITAVMTALHEFEKVADVVYVVVDDRADANFHYVTYSGTPGPGISLLGSMSPPGESDEGLAQFNSGDYRWNESDLQQGGFSFVTLIHEFGHGHGLAHPHDNGGHSGVMQGVDGVINTPAGDVPDPTGVYPAYTLGDYQLNQAVFTMMSYQDGWQSSPYDNADTDVGYGYLGGLMAFDIAAIQDKYGVNEDTATGNNVYTLKDVNEAGTYYSSIWDVAGTDAIVYSGARDANIDLRPATLLYEYGGGGWVSYAFGIFGGFTIANGVTIENATSGAGNDVLIGNAVANVLTGGAGNDTYHVDGADTVVEAAAGGFDLVYSSTGFALGAGSEVEVLSVSDYAATTALNLTGNMFGQQLFGNAGANILTAGGGADALYGLGGNDTYSVDAADVIVEAANQGFDVAYTSGTLILGAGSEVEVLSASSWIATDAVNLSGNEYGQQIYGNAGINLLSGGGGIDALYGFGGNDTYTVDSDDVVFEDAGGGFDQAYSTTSYALAGAAQVEVVSVSDYASTAALNLSGNAIAQQIFGNAGANTLDGRGGADALYGLGGADVFAFTTALGGGNIDYIGDFSAADDTIALDHAVFAGLGLGALAANAFVTGSAAADTDDRIIYNAATGQLLFDADGAGGVAAVQFATLQGAPTIGASDFMVI